MSLENLSDKELEQEVARRKKARQEAAEVANTRRLELLRKILTRELLDALLPEHGRTSCSDDNRVNGFRCHRVRCTRCAMLDFLDGGYMPSDHELILNIEFRERTSNE